MPIMGAQALLLWTKSPHPLVGRVFFWGFFFLLSLFFHETSALRLGLMQ